MNDGTRDLIDALHAMRDADDRRRRAEPGTSAQADAEQEIERLVDRIFAMDGDADRVESEDRGQEEHRSA